MSYYRPNKNVVREWVFRHSAGRLHPSYLCLPGPEMLCINEALKNNSIAKDATIFAVERNATVAKSLRYDLARTGMNHTLFEGDIDSFNSVPTVHLAFIDLTGKLSYELACWLSELQLQQQSMLSITLQSHMIRSSGQFMNSCVNSIRRRHSHLIDEMAKPYKFDNEIYHYNDNQYRYLDEQIFMLAIILKTIFYRYDFIFCGHRTYCDTKNSPMVTFRLGNFTMLPVAQQQKALSFSHLYRN